MPDHTRHGPVDVACKGSPPSPSVPFVAAARKRTGSLPDTCIALLVELVSTSRLMADVGHLASIPTRHTDSEHIRTARDWLVAQFGGLGYTDVATRPWSGNGHSGDNVVCTKHGAGGSSDVIIVARR